MKIFIGSSSKYVSWNTDGSVNETETRKLPLGKLVQSLRKINGFKIEPWWENNTFPTGKYLLDSLIIKSRTCDGGIFIFGQDDKIKIRGKSKMVPRHNVLLECGMFYGSKGKDRTLVFFEGDFSKLALPSDMNGVLLSSLNNKDIINKTVEFFKNNTDEREYQKFTFYFNTKSIKQVIDKDYLEWSTKSLYVGTESARKWKAIEKDPQYLISREIVPRFIKTIHKNKAIDFNKIDNIVSFGPGCGIFDHSVVNEIYKEKLNNANSDIAYIPIDINPHLAFEASNYINEKNPNLRVPFAIIDDFEDNYDYVADIIKKKFNTYNQANLYIMLGGTFSNLEGNESEIVKKLHSWMDSNDYLIIDTFIKSDKYSFANDHQRHISGTLPESYKDLMRNACIKKYFSNNGSNNLKNDLKFIEDINNNLAKFLSDREELSADLRKYTEIEQTSVATYNFSHHSIQKEILIAKRYKFIKLKEFLKQNFNLIYSYDSLKGTTKDTGSGLFLLQKKL